MVGAEYAGKELDVKSAYIVHDKTAYGQGIAEFFTPKADELRIKVLGFEGTEEQADFDGIITPIVAANPDLVYFGGIYSQVGILLKQAREKGVTAKFPGKCRQEEDSSLDSRGKARSGVGPSRMTVGGQFLSRGRCRPSPLARPVSLTIDS